MHIQFLGAAGMVTGSKYLLQTHDGLNILLDCGLFQGGGEDYHTLNRNFGFEPSQIHHLILSHAHIDHAGLIPKLVADGFKGKIWCTAGTQSLCELMLFDSAYIQENDLKYVNIRRKRRGEPELEPLYTPADVELSLSLFHTLPYRKPHFLNKNLSFQFFNSGHILGSAGVFISWSEYDDQKTLFFTGDIGRKKDLILPSPEAFPQADYIICESTYGDRLHEAEIEVKPHLLKIVKETCLLQKGKLIIPAFSVDRTQELIYLLDQLEHEGLLPPIKVFVDSPLSIRATQVMKRHEALFNPEILQYIKKDGDAFDFPNLRYVKDVAESKKINDLKEPCIIISASGMAEAGRVKHHIANNIESAKNTVLIVGYATPNSLAGALRRGDREVKIFGEEKVVNARIEMMDVFSAHADYEELLDYLSCQNKGLVRKLFLVHGDEQARESFKNKLMIAGFLNIELPELTDEYKL